MRKAKTTVARPMSDRRLGALLTVLAERQRDREVVAINKRSDTLANHTRTQDLERWRMKQRFLLCGAGQ